METARILRRGNTHDLGRVRASTIMIDTRIPGRFTPGKVEAIRLLYQGVKLTIHHTAGHGWTYQSAVRFQGKETEEDRSDGPQVPHTDI